MDESFRNIRRWENSPEIEINKFIRLQSPFVLHPPLPLQTNTTTHEKNRGETRLDLCPLAKHSIYLALITGLIWGGSYTLITPQDNSKTRQGLTKEWQLKEKRKWNKKNAFGIFLTFILFFLCVHAHNAEIWGALRKLLQGLFFSAAASLVWACNLADPHQ